MSDLVLKEEEFEQLNSNGESDKPIESKSPANELRQVINQLYCTENFLISNESINSLIQQVCSFKDELFKQERVADCIHENFFTSLILLCCYELVNNLESIHLNSLETISEIIIRYLIDSLRRRQANAISDSVYTNVTFFRITSFHFFIRHFFFKSIF